LKARIIRFNIKISNSGNKEVEDVNGIISFADSLIILESKIEASPKALLLNTTIDSSNSTKFSSPMLNPNEQILFSFLVTSNIDKEKIKVDLRGRGLKGTIFEEKKTEIATTLILGTMGMVILTISLIIFIIFHQRKIIRYTENLAHLEKKKLEEKNNELDAQLKISLQEIEILKRKKKDKKKKGNQTE
jgi:hypothetical protein